ncbi:transcriptional regulator, AbrB family [Solidesulfovibrio fructosivorans JJ]]|uniref:Transcriptional regulator, AbrB family n=1 Tax=Solidesulfovibrio fructosivorans JJ] TaxID=596151 RepID=E1JV44_SOLFR|nr:AbrB/MazE/SpoVT family DNA-binding domain-containing protein [Solidesulfovibrio fructosivorans]EFL51638.1 transcriptional regulator, AbrB family [Solidesulfovibrio fructosivorans JJ]]
METTLDEQGRVTIPADVLKDMGLAPGSRVIVEGQDSAIVIRSLDAASGLVEECGVLVFGGETVGPVEELLDRVREDRTRDVSGLSGR